MIGCKSRVLAHSEIDLDFAKHTATLTYAIYAQHHVFRLDKDSILNFLNSI